MAPGLVSFCVWTSLSLELELDAKDTGTILFIYLAGKVRGWRSSLGQGCMD